MDVLTRYLRFFLLAGLYVTSAPSLGYEVTDRFSIYGLVAAAGQCQFLAGNASEDDACRGGVPLGGLFNY